MACNPHFSIVFWCILGICHHFWGKNRGKIGIGWHFWIFRVFSIDGHSRTIFMFSYEIQVFAYQRQYWYIWELLTSCKNEQKTSYTWKHTIILYYYSMSMGHGLHFENSSRKPGTAYLFHSHVFRHFRVRYRLRQNSVKSTFSPLSNIPKFTKIPPKNPSNPWKINVFSNSPQNHIFIRKFHF